MISVDSKTGESLFRKYLPIIDWVSNYKKKDLPGDAVAGLVVAIMLVPQSMAYAMLAGLPPETGLYASVVPVLVYAVFGSSKVLAVGPVAMVSLLTAAGIADIAGGDPLDSSDQVHRRRKPLLGVIREQQNGLHFVGGRIGLDIHRGGRFLLPILQ